MRYVGAEELSSEEMGVYAVSGTVAGWTGSECVDILVVEGLPDKTACELQRAESRILMPRRLLRKRSAYVAALTEGLIHLRNEFPTSDDYLRAAVSAAEAFFALEEEAARFLAARAADDDEGGGNGVPPL